MLPSNYIDHNQNEIMSMLYVAPYTHPVITICQDYGRPAYFDSTRCELDDSDRQGWARRAPGNKVANDDKQSTL